MLIGGPELKVHQALEIPTQLAKIISYARENVPAYKDFPKENKRGDVHAEIALK